MINKYVSLAAIDLHITPHMFRHTFATSLLEADVDIRYIQEMLGHSSINITEIYTHVALSNKGIFLPLNIPEKIFKYNEIAKTIADTFSSMPAIPLFCCN